MSVNLFGSPQIKRGNEQLSLQRRKDLALLIYLICTAQPQSRDTLAALLWQDQTQTEARSNLRKSLSRLRTFLGDNALVVSTSQIAINPKLSLQLDTARFHTYLKQFHKHGHRKETDGSYLCRECQDALENAARLYFADFLQGFSIPDSPVFEEWQFFQSENLRKNFAQVLEHLTLHFTFTGNYDLAIEYCRKWLSLDKLHEPPHRQLMLLYALSGQQAAALRQFDECARLLRSELDTEPEAETTHLYQAIQKKKLDNVLQGLGQTSLPASAESVPSSQRKIHNLPIHPGLLIGREKELNEILNLLNDPSCRMLTLLGPGGSGKTRLALETATRANMTLEASFKDGVAFIPLAPVTDSSALVDAMIEGLNLRGHVQRADPRQTLLGHISGRNMLLVVDNFEHLLDLESIQLIAAILEAAPSSKILITSRERLNLRGEHLFRVEGLETPGDEQLLPQPPTDSVIGAFSALQLFEQCAARIDPSFRITRENYFPIAQICRQVQGMPLAIELAASWLEAFSLEEINKEIRRSLDFLQSNWRDLPDRQRSLRAVFDSSWELLDRQTRPIVKALSVFRTSFTREAAQTVSGASAKVLLDLTNKSWIQRLSNGRYQIHELLKQFVFEKLSREESILEQVRNQYCEYYANHAYSLWSAMKGAAQKQAYIDVEIEFENIHTAWHWLAAGNKYEIAVQRILPVMFHYTEMRGKTIELRNMLNAAIPSPESSRKTHEQKRAEIILQIARSAFFQDGYPLRYSVHDAIFPIDLKNIQKVWRQASQFTKLHELGFWGILLAYIYGRLFNLKEGVRQIKKMIPYFQREDQSWELANAYLHILKLMVPNREYPDDPIQVPSSYLEEATEIFERLGDKINRGHILMLAGDLKFLQLDLKGAIEEWNAARITYASVGEWGTATNVIWWLMDAYLQLGDFQKVFDCCAEMVEIFMQHGLRIFAVGVLSKESMEKSRYGDLGEALQIRRRCIDMIHETGPEYQFAWNYWEMGELVRLSGDLPGAADWVERSGQIFDREQDHVGMSFYYRGLGDIAMAHGDFASARQHFIDSLKHSRTSNHTWMIAYAEQSLGRAELRLRHEASAEKHILKALKLAVQSRDQGIVLVVLAAYAELLAQQGQQANAIHLASVVKGHFLTWHEIRKRAGDLLADLKKSTSRAKFGQAEKKAISTDLWALVNDLA